MYMPANMIEKYDSFSYNGCDYIAISDWSICGVLAVKDEHYNENGVYTYDVMENLELHPDQNVFYFGSVDDTDDE